MLRLCYRITHTIYSVIEPMKRIFRDWGILSHFQSRRRKKTKTIALVSKWGNLRTQKLGKSINLE